MVRLIFFFTLFNIVFIVLETVSPSFSNLSLSSIQYQLFFKGLIVAQFHRVLTATESILMDSRGGSTVSYSLYRRYKK